MGEPRTLRGRSLAAIASDLSLGASTLGGVSLRRQRQIACALTATMVVPIVIAIVRMAVGPKYFPTIDWAITELRVRDVSHEFVTVGPYSRYGWNHPGPLLFYVLAIPYRLSGESSISMHITAATLNLGCVVASCALAWRRMRLAGVVAVAVPLALLVHALGPNEIRDPWNPFVPILALFLLMMLMWSVAVEDVWCAVPGVVVASFIVQSHVGFAGIVGAVMAGSLLVVFVQRVRIRRHATVDGSGGGVRRPALAKVSLAMVVALAVCWFPVGYGALVNHDGNLSRLVDFFTADHATAGFDKALRVMGLQWGPRPEWIFGSRGASRFGPAYLEAHWWLAIGLVLAGAALVVAFRRHQRDVVVLGMLVTVALVMATVSAAEIVGPIFPYLVRWTWVAGSFLGVIALLALVGLGTERQVRAGAIVAVGGLLALGVASTIGAIDADAPNQHRTAGEQELSAQVLRALPPGRGPVLIDGYREFFAVPGLALQIERRGIPVMITPGQPVIYGYRRQPRGPQYRAVLRVLEGSAVRTAKVDGRKIATYSRRDRAGHLVDDVAVYLVRKP